MDSLSETYQEVTPPWIFTTNNGEEIVIVRSLNDYKSILREWKQPEVLFDVPFPEISRVRNLIGAVDKLEMNSAHRDICSVVSNALRHFDAHVPTIEDLIQLGLPEITAEQTVAKIHQLRQETMPSAEFFWQ